MPFNVFCEAVIAHRQSSDTCTCQWKQNVLVLTPHDDLYEAYLLPLYIMTCLETGDTYLEIVGVPINTLSNLARRYLTNIPCCPSEASMQKFRLVRCGPHGIVTRKVLYNGISLAKRPSVSGQLSLVEVDIPRKSFMSCTYPHPS